jgi:hypothetical protein
MQCHNDTIASSKFTCYSNITTIGGDHGHSSTLELKIVSTLSLVVLLQLELRIFPSLT